MANLGIKSNDLWQPSKPSIDIKDSNRRQSHYTQTPGSPLLGCIDNFWDLRHPLGLFFGLVKDGSPTKEKTASM